MSDGNGATVRTVLFDFKKVFDLTDHRILVSKLRVYDIPEAVLSWITDFLTDRKQRVNLELNEPKCKELRISFSTKPASFDPIVINGKYIDVVPTAKLLGLTLSGNLKWNNHVDEIVKKSRKQTPVLSLPAESFRFENSRTDPVLQDSHSSNYRVRMPHVPRQSTSVSVYRH